MTEPDRGTARVPFPLPLVGRRTEHQVLLLALDDAIDGRGRVALLTGESGIGKSRLLQQLMSDAQGRGATVLTARGYALEADRPYGLWADAFGGIAQMLGPAFSTTVRGLERDLAAIIPALSTGGTSRVPVEDKGHLFWNFTQFVGRVARRTPLLLVFEDLHFADAPSVELAHFVARQLENMPVLLVGSWVQGTPGSVAVETMSRSLASPGNVRRALQPLTRQHLRELMQRAFGAEGADVDAFADALHARTSGHPFFVEELLKTMVEGGSLRWTAEGWTGFEHGVTRSLPASIRESVERRVHALGMQARALAEVVALGGAHATLDLLEIASGFDAGALAAALDELVTHGFLLAPGQANGAYTFTHHMVQVAVEAGVSPARARAIHRALVAAFARLPATGAVGAHVARHLLQAGLEATPEALPHFVSAGRDALARHADADAVRWLREAVQIRSRLPDGAPVDESELLADLARAEQRTGDFEGARQRLVRALDLATTRDDQRLRSRLLRQMATLSAATGQGEDALAALREAISAADRAGALGQGVTSRVTAAMTLQSLGRASEGKELLERVLPQLGSGSEPRLAANVHRALVLLYGWTGPSAKARHHAALALEAARAAGDDDVAWSVHWALSVLEGFSGHGDGVRRHREEAGRLAGSLGSPLREALTAEIAIEYAAATGAWDEARAWSQRAVPIARAVAPRTLLPRLLVWTGLVLLAQDEATEARAMLDEAWELSGAGTPGSVQPTAVQNVILAHTGRAAVHLADGDWGLAREVSERGLALADRYGMVAWGIHRLLPLVAEAALWQQDYVRAEEVAERLRRDGGSLQHRLAVAWASTIDALVARLRDGRPDAAARLIAAAEELEAIPFMFHAARVRRNAGQLLASDGHVEEAARQLRLAHDVFLRSGAELELRGTRTHLRSLGVRLPPRTVQEGAGALTGRELDIARCVAERLSNKEIAQRLDISPRTVSTHLSNIFQKLEVDSRGALADRVRSDPRLAPPGL